MRKKIVYRFVLLLLLMKSALALAAADRVILNDGSTMEGKIVQITPEGKVCLQLHVEQGAATIIFDKGGYLRAELGETPDIYTKACIYLEQGDCAEAIKLFNKVYDKYGQLGWGDKALYKIGLIYESKGDLYEAIKFFDKAFKEFPYSEQKDQIKAELDRCRYDIGKGYYKQKEYDTAIKYLREISQTVSQKQAAEIQVLTGDCYIKQENYEEALLSYLQVVLVHSNVEELQPEALYKTGLILEHLEDQRAEEYYKELTEKFPHSSYARKVRTKTKLTRKKE